MVHQLTGHGKYTVGSSDPYGSIGSIGSIGSRRIRKWIDGEAQQSNG
jgi:hypothetical protein